VVGCHVFHVLKKGGLMVRYYNVYCYVDLQAQSKPDVVHTYLQNFQTAKTCDITYAIRSDEPDEYAINLSC
jgi:hypothetical protein